MACAQPFASWLGRSGKLWLLAMLPAGAAHALALAIELEELCEQYWRASQLGAPVLLDSAEMARVQEKFASYGVQRPR